MENYFHGNPSESPSLVMANFVMTVAGAILASIGIEALGLDAFSSNSLG